MVRTLALTTASAALLAALSACAPQGGGYEQSAPEGISQSEGEAACRRALAEYHSTSNVRVVSSEPYQGGGRFVRADIGRGELWQCIAYSDGSTGELQFLAAGETPSATVGRPAVGSEYDLTEFEGARAGQGEGGIRALGYEPIRSEGLTTFWFNRQTGACARITTSQGRYSSVNMLPAEDC